MYVCDRVLGRTAYVIVPYQYGYLISDASSVVLVNNNMEEVSCFKIPNPAHICVSDNGKDAVVITTEGEVFVIDLIKRQLKKVDQQHSEEGNNPVFWSDCFWWTDWNGSAFCYNTKDGGFKEILNKYNKGIVPQDIMIDKKHNTICFSAYVKGKGETAIYRLSSDDSTDKIDVPLKKTGLCIYAMDENSNVFIYNKYDNTISTFEIIKNDLVLFDKREISHQTTFDHLSVFNDKLILWSDKCVSVFKAVTYEKLFEFNGCYISNVSINADKLCVGTWESAYIFSFLKDNLMNE